ncbi:YfbM family protein [Actinosynnema sp. NPDC050436]|uniref:YfbM family protein n=1 Tax=Actinosynnema sp. NPDC050436 TaxID=3155659 RepID=UPI0033FF501B
MIGNHLRLTLAELDRALEDPAWVGELVDGVDEDDARLHSTGKAWHALAFATGRRGFPVDVVRGEHDVPGAEDRGYGPPRYLTRDEVWDAARFAARTDPGALLGDLTPEDLVAAEVYPVSWWADEDALHLLAGEYAELSRFLRSAARSGDAVLTWIS